MSDSVIILGEPVPGTDLLRRFRRAGTLKYETSPRYIPPIPRPADAWVLAMQQARRAGYAEVVLDDRALRIEPEPVRRPGLRLVRDDPRPGVLRRIGEALRIVSERA